MVKSVESRVENYVASVTKSIQNYKKYLMADRKMKEDYAIEKAIDYGIKMLQAGLGETVTPKKAESLFQEQAEISSALAKYCHQISESGY